MAKSYRSCVWLAAVTFLASGFGLATPGAAAGSGQDTVKVPGRVFEQGLDEPQRAAAARPRRLDTTKAIELEMTLPPFTGGIPEKSEKPFGAPLTIGTHRDLPAAFKVERGARDLVWEAAREGGEVAVFSLTSPGAEALRLAIDFHRLPRGAEVRFYSPSEPAGALGPFEADFLRRAARASRREGPFWSPVISGETMAVEIWVPSWKRGRDVRFSVREVSHIYRSVRPKDLSHLGNSGSCNRDVRCFRKWTTAGNAVAKLVFEFDGGTGLCTGQLMNNPDGDFLLLTAAHCISTRSEAGSTAFFWFFERDGCDGANPTTVTQTGGGGKLLFTSAKPATGLVTDHTLMRLRRDPPAGVSLLGWIMKGSEAKADPEDSIGEKVHGIHHPGGDAKKASRGKVVDSWQLLANGNLVDADPPTHYEVQWRKGTTEGGSSGSAILTGRRWPRQFVIGDLTGGSASCESRRDPDFYGIFEETFRRFKKFRRHFQ